MDKKFLEIWKVGKSYGEAVIVEEFTVTVAPGEFVSVIGHSGCGKSTVLSMVAGLSPIDQGGIVLDGKEIRGPGNDRGVVGGEADSPRGPAAAPPRPVWRRQPSAGCGICHTRP